VKVCKRPLVNEVLGALVTEFAQLAAQIVVLSFLAF
jgi:hypothetical protein